MKSALASRVYWHEIFAVLALKSLALVLIYFLFFAKEPPISPAGAHLFPTVDAEEGAPP